MCWHVTGRGAAGGDPLATDRGCSPTSGSSPRDGMSLLLPPRKASSSQRWGRAQLAAVAEPSGLGISAGRPGFQCAPVYPPVQRRLEGTVS